MVIPEVTLVTCNEPLALLMWSDHDGYGIEFADGSRRIVHAAQFVRYIQHGEEW
jgi:hypothetical protein